MRFEFFPFNSSKVVCLLPKSEARSSDAAPVKQNHLRKLEDPMLQNATPLRKSAPWAPNVSDGDVFCTARAMRNASFADPLQTSYACHRFWSSYKTDLNFVKKRRLPKVVRTWSVFSILASTRAFSTPQRPKVVRDRHFYHFWLRNVLRATAASAFWTSQFPKTLRTWGVFSFLISKSASRHNGVQFFISHLARWLRTRRFSEPTFRPSGATNQWKKPQWIATFLPFSRTCIFFLLTLSLRWSSLFFSSLLFSSLTLPTSAFPSVHIVGSLTSKFPSMNVIRRVDTGTA